MKANRVCCDPGDTIALGTPIFTPYLEELPHLEDYGLHFITIQAPQENRFQFTDMELKKLEDPRNQGFPRQSQRSDGRCRISKEVIGKIANLVKTKRPDLMILTDDVYGTFVHDFRSLLGELPQKHHRRLLLFQVCRLPPGGASASSRSTNRIFSTKMIAKLPDADLKALDKRYGTLVLEPRKIEFVDRIVADSRDGDPQPHPGLSLPQQVMMSLFSLAEMMDGARVYQKACMEIVHRRAKAMIEGLGIEAHSEHAVQRLLRSNRLRVLCAQEYRRGRRRIPEKERPPARPRLPSGRGSRDRAAERRRVRGARLVVARVPGQPG